MNTWWSASSESIRYDPMMRCVTHIVRMLSPSFFRDCTEDEKELRVAVASGIQRRSRVMTVPDRDDYGKSRQS